jgi:hypothetical protein
MSDQYFLTLYRQLPQSSKEAVGSFMEFLLYKKEFQPQKPDSAHTTRNAYGSLKGKVWMAPDFDEPLEEFKDYM